MIAAIYARKSTDQEKSVTRQLEQARRRGQG
jgi:DNA invertase Pin-like site-specific DNA recombinase